MGIISNQIKGNVSFTSGNFEFAYLHKRCELIIRKSPAMCATDEDFISLKNGSYRIEGGVLYIKAIRMYFGYLPDYCEKENIWSPRAIYWPNTEFFSSLENPPEVKEVIIKRWWRNNLKFQGVELSEDDFRWYKFKKETQFEMAIASFKLHESILANE